MTDNVPDVFPFPDKPRGMIISDMAAWADRVMKLEQQFGRAATATEKAKTVINTMSDTSSVFMAGTIEVIVRQKIELEDEVSQHKYDIERLKTEHNSTIAAKDARRESLEKQLADLHKLRAETQRENSDLAIQKGKLNVELSTKLSEIATLKEQVDRLTFERDDQAIGVKKWRDNWEHADNDRIAVVKESARKTAIINRLKKFITASGRIVPSYANAKPRKR